MESRSVALLEKLENLIATKSVVGETINVDGVLIIPFIDVSFGVGIGGSYGATTEKGNGEGGGAGAKMSPSAVLVVNGETVQLVNIKNQDSLNKLIDMVPNILNKFNIGPKDSGCGCGDECGCHGEDESIEA